MYMDDPTARDNAFYDAPRPTVSYSDDIADPSGGERFTFHPDFEAGRSCNQYHSLSSTHALRLVKRSVAYQLPGGNRAARMRAYQCSRIHEIALAQSCDIPSLTCKIRCRDNLPSDDGMSSDDDFLIDMYSGRDEEFPRCVTGASNPYGDLTITTAPGRQVRAERC